MTWEQSGPSRLQKVLLLSLLFFSSCATSYQPVGFSGGYSDVQLDRNTFKVSFSGNGYTGRSRVESYLLYRCAELTAQQGYDYFVILDGGTDSDRMYYQTQGTYSGTTTFSGRTAYSRGAYTPGMNIPITRHSGTVTIKMYQGQKPDVAGAYQAKEIMGYLRKQFSGLPDDAEQASAGPETDDGSRIQERGPVVNPAPRQAQPAASITVTPVLMPPPIQAPVTRLAVVPLAEPANGKVAVLLDSVLSFIRTRHPQIVLVERDLRPVLDELHLQYSGRVDDETAVRVGRLAGVDTILVYRIDPLPAEETGSASIIEVPFETRLVQVESGHVLFRQTATATVTLPRGSTPDPEYARRHEEAKRQARAELRARGLDEGYLYEMVKIIEQLQASDPQWFRRVPDERQIPQLADEVAKRVRAGTARRGSVSDWPESQRARIYNAGVRKAAAPVLAALVAALGDNPLGVVPYLKTEGEGVKVSGVLESSPAHSVGLLPEDRILEINEKPFRTWTDPVSLPATLTVERAGERLTVRVLKEGSATSQP